MEERALNLLARGLSQETVAQACGVDPSRISQLMADEGFRTKLVSMRFEKLGEHSKLDDRYDKMEAKLQDQLEKVIPMIHKPKEVMEAIKIINGLKRRSGLVDNTESHAGKVVTLIMPVAIMNKYQIKIDEATNRVIETQGQPLLTAQSNQVVLENEARSKRKGQEISAIDL